MTNKRLRVNLPPGAPGTKCAKKISRPRGTANEPVPVDTQPSPSPSSSPSPLPIASQAPNFEATIRESRPEAEIVAPTEGSEQATVAASAAGNTIADEANFRIAGDHYEGPGQAGYMPMAIVSPCRATYRRLRGSVTTATSTSLRILAAEYMTLVNRHQQQGVTWARRRQVTICCHQVNVLRRLTKKRHSIAQLARTARRPLPTNSGASIYKSFDLQPLAG
jgi:hypothetical protein